jgi:hypothetical protein
MPAILAKNRTIALGLLGFYEFDVEKSIAPLAPRGNERSPNKFCCLTESAHSSCRHGRNTSAATVAEVAAIVWPSAEHDYQVARSWRPRARVVDSAANDHRRIERSTFAAE